MTIAVAGKGGTGKTTVASMIIRYLSERRQGTILAIDADPSSNLHTVLGMELDMTIGDIREDMLDEIQARSGTASSMSRVRSPTTCPSSPRTGSRTSPSSRSSS